MHKLDKDIWIIAGPTASGKSGLALVLAQKHNGCIINADSMQIYDGLPIISAQPTLAEQALVPHKLYGHVGMGQAYSAGHWVADAVAAIDHALKLGQQPIVVGGTGFWLQALIHGLSPIPNVPEAVRQRTSHLYDLLGPQNFHAALAQIDAKAAQRLPPADRQRLIRAREVWEATGQTLSQWQAAPRQSAAPSTWQFKLVALLPDKTWLQQRINSRFEQMLGLGAVLEAKTIKQQLENGQLNPQSASLKAVGLAPLLAYADGQLNLDQATNMAQLHTRQYAKRQYTWLRHQTVAHPTRLMVKTIDEVYQLNNVDAWLTDAS